MEGFDRNPYGVARGVLRHRIERKRCDNSWIDAPHMAIDQEKWAIKECLCQLLEEAPAGGKLQFTVEPVEEITSMPGGRKVVVDMAYFVPEEIPKTEELKTFKGGEDTECMI